MLAPLLTLALAHSVTIAAVGDVMLARWVGRRIEREGPARVLQGVRGALRSADLVCGNLECALTTAPATAHKSIILHAKPGALPALKGLSVLSLVNNHAGDCGPAGLADSAQRLRGVGIEPLVSPSEPVILSRGGVRFAFLGLIDLPGDHLVPGWARLVAQIRPSCDVLVAAIHWGVEGSPQPSHAQRLAAKELAEAGVDVILGSHPHVLQPIQILEGRDRRPCLVAYSLGNFVFDAKPGPQTWTEILYFKAGSAGVTAYAIRRCTISRGFPLAEAKPLRWVGMTPKPRTQNLEPKT
ncbi:MAG TPA: CapA family protein [Fimbriimonadaceae bacterium]|nr:CapA family protein [Fimbriimonadaceae bacterium]